MKFQSDMDLNRYKNFLTEDFVLDEDFISMARTKTDGANIAERLKVCLPEKSEEVALAFEMLNNLKTAKTPIRDKKKEEILEKVYRRAQTHVRLTIFKYAAAVFLFAGAGTASWFILHPRHTVKDFATSPQATDAENTELILADGKRVEIGSKQSKIEYASNSASISLNDTARLEQPNEESRENYNQVNIPYGKRSYILLSDGTQVWLNSGSRLVYPPVFKGNKREVFVEGEACFNVSENKDKPFYVCTGSFKVRVLGTRFVVQAYSGEKESYTVLIEGKVSLSTNDKLFSKTYEMLPSQKATLPENGDEFNITALNDVDNYTDWINGYLNFEHEDLISLAKRVSRYYNIDIEIHAKNSSSSFSGKLDLKDDPERILRGLSIIFKTKYEKNGNKFVFYD